MLKHKAKLAKQEPYQTCVLIRDLEVILRPQMYQKAESPKVSTSAEVTRVCPVIISMLWRMKLSCVDLWMLCVKHCSSWIVH